MVAFIAALFGLVYVYSGVVQNTYGATTKHATRQTGCTRNCPPLLNNWGIVASSVHSTNQFTIELDYGGGQWTAYPQIPKKTDTVPFVGTYLTLPAGASITKWNVRSQSTKDCVRSKPRALSSTKWYWPCKGLPYGRSADFNYTVNWGTATTQCMTAVAHPMYYKRVRRNGHYVHVLRPIPHAPVQTGNNAGYGC